MKILHLIDHLGLGGAQKILEGIFGDNRFSKNLFLISLKKVKNESTFLSKKNIKLRQCYYNPLVILEIIKILKKYKITILHVHLRCIYIAIIIKALYPQIILIYHEHGYLSNLKKWKVFYFKIFSNKIDMFIACSKTVKKQLIENTKIQNEKIKIIYNYAHFENMNIQKEQILEIKKRIRSTDTTFIITFIGRLNKVKNIPTLLQAVSLLDFKNWRLVIVGEGCDRHLLEAETKKLGIDKKTFFFGYQEDIVPFYQISDIIVLPSISEASPLAYYESATLGIPMIGSDIPTLKEFITDNRSGLLFERANANHLSAQIDKIKNNPELKKEISQNTKDESKKYTINKFFKETEEIYKYLSAK